MDIDNKGSVYICKICSKSFSKSSYRNKHLKNTHRINSKGESLPTINVSCVFCDKSFKHKRSLQSHIDFVHLTIHSKERLIFECDQCNYKTLYKWNLNSHQKKHNIRKDLSTTKLKCSLCNSSFTYLKHLRHHERKLHGVGNKSKASVKRKCPMCSFESTKISRNEINGHFEKVHNIDLKWNSFSFENVQHFYKWKQDIEKQTVACYLQKSKSKTRLHYVCHRNGNYIRKGKNIRKLRLGSCKINAYCPSEIKVILQESGFAEVKYLPVHVGHENELKYIRWAKERLIRNRQNRLRNKTSVEEKCALLIDENSDGIIEAVEEEMINNDICTEKCEADIENKKVKVMDKLKLLVNYINENVISKQQLDYVESNIEQIMSTLDITASTAQKVIEPLPFTNFSPPKS